MSNLEIVLSFCWALLALIVLGLAAKLVQAASMLFDLHCRVNSLQDQLDRQMVQQATQPRREPSMWGD